MYTIDDFLANKTIQFDFAEAYEDISIVRFVRNLAAYHEELKAKKQQEELAAQESALEEDDDHICDNECCHKQTKKLASIKDEQARITAELTRELVVLKDQMENLHYQFGKFYNPGANKPGTEDIVLGGGQWVLRHFYLNQSKLDSSLQALARLLDNVFGPAYWDKFKKYGDLPEDVKQACVAIFGKFCYLYYQYI